MPDCTPTNRLMSQNLVYPIHQEIIHILGATVKCSLTALEQAFFVFKLHFPK